MVDACLEARLPDETGKPLKPMPRSDAWLAEIAGFKAWPAHEAPNLKMLAWLPNETIAKKWMQYVKDTAVADTTPPPSPTNVHREGNRIVWNCRAVSGKRPFTLHCETYRKTNHNCSRETRK